MQSDKDFEEYIERLEQFPLANDVPVTGELSAGEAADLVRPN